MIDPIVDFPPPFRLYQERTTPDDVVMADVLAATDKWEAIAVGPESDFDSYFLFPSGLDSRDGQPPVVATSLGQPQQRSIKVSVESPYYGTTEGKWLMKSHLSQLTVGGSTRRSMSGINAAYRGTVDLLFYPRRPPNLPLKRPPAYNAARYTFGSAASAETDVLIMPTFGRKGFTVSAQRVSGSVAYSSGTFTLRVYGETFGVRSGGLDFFATTDLTGLTKVYSSNAFDFNGEIDACRWNYIRATVQEASLIGPDGSFEVMIQAVD